MDLIDLSLFEGTEEEKTAFCDRLREKNDVNFRKYGVKYKSKVWKRKLMLILSLASGQTGDNTRICFAEGYKKDIPMKETEILL